jgi:hypothetical protein
MAVGATYRPEWTSVSVSASAASASRRVSKPDSHFWRRLPFSPGGRSSTA